MDGMKKLIITSIILLSLVSYAKGDWFFGFYGGSSTAAVVGDSILQEIGDPILQEIGDAVLQE